MDSKFRFRLADVTILLSFTGISLILLISLLSEIPLVAFILLAVMVFEVRRGYRVMVPLTQVAGDRGPSHHQAAIGNFSNKPKPSLSAQN